MNKYEKTLNISFYCKLCGKLVNKFQNVYELCDNCFSEIEENWYSQSDEL